MLKKQTSEQPRFLLNEMYFLWVDKEEEPPPFLNPKSYVHRAKNKREAARIIKTLGFPLIISFGKGSLNTAKYIKKTYVKSPEFTYRIHCMELKGKIKRIME